MARQEEEREEYDQYNDDPTFNNRQREYYNQRYNTHIFSQSAVNICSQTRRNEEQKGTGAAATTATATTATWRTRPSTAAAYPGSAGAAAEAAEF